MFLGRHVQNHLGTITWQGWTDYSLTMYTQRQSYLQNCAPLFLKYHIVESNPQ
jgi:hypothetical protein